MISSHHVAAAMRAWVRAVSSVLLLGLAVAIFLPLLPQMPDPSLDGSWVQAMNEGVARRMAFGRELVFTFGPYAALYSKTYHPDTDTLALFGGTYLALSFVFACHWLGRDAPAWWWPTLLLVLAATALHSRDTVFFVYPLLVALISTQHGEAAGRAARGGSVGLPAAALIAAPLGLLPLIKGSFLIFTLAALLLSAAYLAYRREPRHALMVCVMPLITMPAFWGLSGQSLADLPRYFATVLPFVSGYTEAMALDGFHREIRAYVGVSAALLLALALRLGSDREGRVFIGLVLALLLLIVFKGGFVRHDGHSVMSAATLAVAAVLVAALNRSRWGLPAVAVAAAMNWWYVVGHYVPPLDAAVTSVRAAGLAWSEGLPRRWTEPESLRQEYDAGQMAIGQAAKLPPLSGSVDIYPHQQTELIASGNRWRSRPVLQSYSAYTPALAEMNRDHLLGPLAPDHIIFNVQPIDQRFPSLDDGASWPTLLSHYKPTAWTQDSLVLQRRPVPLSLAAAGAGLSARHSLGQRIEVPQADAAQWVEIDIRRTLPGSLMSLLFKPTLLRIEVELEDGRRTSHRLLSALARGGFLLSPLIENTVDFGHLYGGRAHLAGHAVKAFRVMPQGGDWHGWRDQYSVTFKPVLLPADAVLRKPELFDVAFNQATGLAVGRAAACLASIDALNGVPPASTTKLRSGPSLNVHGWADDGADAPPATGAPRGPTWPLICAGW